MITQPNHAVYLFKPIWEICAISVVPRSWEDGDSLVLGALASIPVVHTRILVRLAMWLPGHGMLLGQVARERRKQGCPMSKSLKGNVAKGLIYCIWYEIRSMHAHTSHALFSWSISLWRVTVTDLKKEKHQQQRVVQVKKKSDMTHLSTRTPVRLFLPAWTEP